MSSWRSSNVDEVVWAAFAEKSSLPLKEEEYWRVPGVVSLTVIRCGLPMVGGASCLGAVVEVAADDDGVVPGCLGGGVPQSPAWCSTLQMTAPSKVLPSGRASPMGSMTWQPQ